MAEEKPYIDITSAAGYVTLKIMHGVNYEDGGAGIIIPCGDVYALCETLAKGAIFAEAKAQGLKVSSSDASAISAKQKQIYPSSRKQRRSRKQNP